MGFPAAAAMSAITGAIDITGGFFNANQSRKAQSRQLRYDKELSKYNYDLELEQWHRANAYNSPSAQMERYRQAGLNPNLVYGQSNEAANSSPTAGGNVGSGTFHPVDFGQAVMRGIDAYTAVNQQRLNEQKQEEEIKAIRQSVINQKTDNLLRALEVEEKDSGRPYWRSNARLSNLHLKYSAENLKKTNQNIQRDILQKIWEYDELNPLRKISQQRSNRNLLYQGDILKYDKDSRWFSTSLQRTIKQTYDALNKRFKRVFGKDLDVETIIELLLNRFE